MKSSVFNSFLEPDHSETQAFREHNEIEREIEVDVHRLDDIVSNLKSEFDFRNVFLKLDTQGFDLDVFAGASGCLDLILGVQTEVSVLPIYKNMPTFDTSLKIFRASGFEVSGLYALSEERFPHAVEFDCIYLPKAN